MDYLTLTQQQKKAEYAQLTQRYETFRAGSEKLDISRGKPAPEMLALAEPMLDVLHSGSDLIAEDGTDVRNYGRLGGIPEIKRVFSDILQVEPEDLLVYGNSSLNLMYDTLLRGYVFGVAEGLPPLSTCVGRKWLCPVPGYDRHFRITERLGFQMINIAMDENGPDMDAVEAWVSRDPAVKGIWCVPVYSNPGGVVYSQRTVERLAALRPAAPDFRIYCDDAYAVHHLNGVSDRAFPNLLTEARRQKNAELVYLFTSTSKISFAGGGVSAFAAAPGNLGWQRSLLSVQTIGHDKLNQLRHARFFKDGAGVAAHMQKYMALLRPKFETVLTELDAGLGDCGIAQWSRPAGGYFISLTAPKGTAKRVIALCAEAGLKLTEAGAAFPYGIDPDDSNIRIAPSYPGLPILQKATQLLCTAVRMAWLEQNP